jgi:hypothetical protein
MGQFRVVCASEGSPCALTTKASSISREPLLLRTKSVLLRGKVSFSRRKSFSTPSKTGCAGSFSFRRTSDFNALRSIFLPGVPEGYYQRVFSRPVAEVAGDLVIIAEISEKDNYFL